MVESGGLFGGSLPKVQIFRETRKLLERDVFLLLNGSFRLPSIHTSCARVLRFLFPLPSSNDYSHISRPSDRVNHQN